MFLGSLSSYTTNGAKVMEMTLAEPYLGLMHSFGLSPHALSKLPKTFQLTELTKGCFPYFFNTEANQHYVGPLPHVKYYYRDGIKPEAWEAFYKWYDAH